MKKNSEVRIQESESRRDARSSLTLRYRRLANASLRDAKGERYQSGIQTAQELKTTKFPIWWGCKNADYSSASRTENIAEF